jgi:intraflagellar transport protein 140
MPEKAVLLFQKGGNLSRAVELCFRSRLFDALREIADALTAETDPQLLQSCAEFFLDHGQYAKTVHLFAVAGEYTKALDLCVLHNIELTEDTAEQLCPPLGAPGAETADARNAVLSKIAKCCKRQGNFHLACKKYTQAGDKLKAMKCLLKSGDTQKICYFAGVSRTREIYILAANYLQSLDWHSDAGVMKNIVAFYTKAKAMEQLASFYDACAQVEIDEYRDYEKALGALKEAHEYMTKARVQGREDKLASLQQRIVHVEAFVNARKMVKSSPEQMVAMCHDLLEQADIESAIRVGDVYALMVEWFSSQRRVQEAHKLIEQMRERGIVLSPYVDAEMVRETYAAVGAVPPNAPSNDVAGGGEDEIEEEM